MHHSTLLHTAFVPNWLGTLLTSFRLDPGYNCMVPVKSKYELERRGLTLALQ